MPRFTYAPYVNPFGATIAELLLRRGDIAAQQTARLGDIEAQRAFQTGQAWSQALGGIGQAVAAIPGELQAQRTRQTETALRQQQMAGVAARTAREQEEYARAKADREALDAAFANPNGIEEAIKALPGHLQPEAIKTFESMNTLRDEARLRSDAARKARMEYLGGLAASIRRRQYDPAYALGAIHHARQAFGDDPTTVQALDEMRRQVIEQPESIRDTVDWVVDQSSFREEFAPKRMTVRPGETLVETTPEGVTPLMTAADPRAEETARHHRRLEEINAMTAGRAEAAQAETARHNRAMETIAEEQRRRPTANVGLESTLKLRDRFVRETQAATTVSQQLALMKSSVQAAEAGNLAAGSQGVLVTFQKILDPTSVVRESEYARSAAGQSLVSRMEGIVTRLTKGGAGVPVRELKQFVMLAEQFARDQAASAAETKRQIDALATQYGLDPATITREVGPAAPEPPPAPSGVPPGLARHPAWKR